MLRACNGDSHATFAISQIALNDIAKSNMSRYIETRRIMQVEVDQKGLQDKDENQ